jgi:DNA repair protein RadC
VSKQTKADQRTRLQNVLGALLLQTNFTLRQLKELAPFERPAFVTRVIHELERDGFLREGEEGTFRWANEGTDFAADKWLDDKLFAPRLAQTPEADRPRERLLAQGAASLKVAELLAILIRSGQPGESALQAGDKIAARFIDNLEDLVQAGPGELKGVAKSVAKTAYCQIMAGIEQGRRVAKAQAERLERVASIKSSAEALAYCRERFARLAADGAREEFHVLPRRQEPGASHPLCQHRVN